MRYLFFIAIILFSISGIAQKKTQKAKEVSHPKNDEIHLNALSLIVAKRFDVTYEHIFNEESSVGISLLTNVNGGIYFSRKKYSITPYYRHYFSHLYAAGLFFEAFSMFNAGEGYYSADPSSSYHNPEDIKPYKDLALGISAGQKFITRRGFVGLIYIGLGRNLFDVNAPDMVGRFGVSFGFRF
jgi:hypothetical protein